MSSLQTIENKYTQLREHCIKAKSIVETLESEKENAEDCMLKLERAIEINKDVSEFFRKLIITRKQTAKERIEKLVTHALKVVFEDESYSFRIETVERRNQIELQFYVVMQIGDEQVEIDPLTAKGGTVVNIISFILRLIVLLMSSIPKILIMDERFAHVSRQYLPNIAKLLAELQKLCDVQIILVTHKPEFTEVANKVVRLYKDESNHVKVKDTNQYDTPGG